ncbi:MAG: futalosine hydrolase [Bacteroidia bacterium]|nr:futalosine hydrolase [Bacteroidia bacterium]
MKVLLVAATRYELTGWADRSTPLPASGNPWLANTYTLTLAGHPVVCLVTGVGMVNTAFALGAYLSTQPAPELLLNVGICGSYGPAHPPGTLVEVREEVYAELGAEDGEQWLDLTALGFAAFAHGGEPVYNRLVNPTPPLPHYPGVRGATLQQVTGHPATHARLVARWQPEVETMEGAAVLQAALQADVPCTCLRAVSNWVAPRSEQPWAPAPALEALRQGVTDLFERLPR